jgi:glycosyltransferase involved in cell wall biosynthesis
MKKIVHIIAGLGSGGAENMLYKLIKYSNNQEYEHEVVSLIDEGTIGHKIIAEGIKLHCININKNNFLASIIRLKKICRDCDLISTWLYHADLIGFIVSKLLLRKKLIWNIRHSNLNSNANKSSTLWVVKFNSLVSKFVDLITYNSTEAYNNHLNYGFSKKRNKLIPNGFELDNFVYDHNKRNALRKYFGFDINQKVLITIGRWNIQKDYYTLLEAIDTVKKNGHQFKLIMVGNGLDTDNTELNSIIRKYSIEEYVILLGKRSDIPDLLSMADVYVSSSLGESFSNAIGEAMACELTCIVTDVGESKILVGDTGEVVSPGCPSELAESIIKLLKFQNIGRNVNARKRILENYEISSIVEKFDSVYKDVISQD